MHLSNTKSILIYKINIQIVYRKISFSLEKFLGILSQIHWQHRDIIYISGEIKEIY